ncbi:hypothetical protein [Flavobacterium sp.]|jgi:hypothetical protein|uniref:hypothetical protein n=1 Tax=Flavobacterium sp. TaxID=239 RepID=UPI002B554130|nr:hypothetical protein [Flavobacterium sp.]HQA73802.1 hypothetical protein [Flavobacterium sp.]
MLASNFNTIQNHFLLEEMEKLQSQDFVSKAQLSEIKNNTKTTKTNSNILMRIGFFLLGNFLISSILGFCALFLSVLGDQNAIAFCFLLASIGCIVASELIYDKNYFAYGFDDSFILSITLFFCVALGLFTENVIAVLFVFVLISSFCSVRYVHVPSTFFALMGLIGLVGYLVTEEDIIPSYYLPILLFLLSIGLYFFQLQLVKRSTNFIYTNVFQIIKIFSLVLGYASLNYYVVRELSTVLLDLQLQPNQEIPFAPLFYFATFALPVFYISFGLKNKDRFFFWIGLLSLALGFATIRYYYSILPIEYALLLGGSILFAMVYFSIKKVQNNTVGITFKEDKSLNPMAFDLVKAILINANVHSEITTTNESPMEFGGGGFSGGGSGGNF